MNRRDDPPQPEVSQAYAAAFGRGPDARRWLHGMADRLPVDGLDPAGLEGDEELPSFGDLRDPEIRVGPPGWLNGAM